MSLGKVSASAVSGSLETTVALAAANFDFSLLKIEAPKEYRELGLSLSKKRSTEAEEGELHVTARKLSALFADVMPKTPSLYRVYGLRVSEIAKSELYHPNTNQHYGMFAEHLGADGTSIWAAATSGEMAIGLHLLGCMLARMWSQAEAVSIWVEFVEERRRVINNSEKEGIFGILAMQSSRVSLSRSQLTAWDASARAWLQTADGVKSFQQTQLMLILKNLGTSVNHKPFLYESVLEAWTSSLIAMENLVKGSSQSVENGGALLGLASWHLYPDMLVLGNLNKTIIQKDALIPLGTMITVGLRNRDIEKRGVSWSLPLAHLRYYGDPVPVTRSFNEGSSRVTIEQLLLVGLGALTGAWARKRSSLKYSIQLFSMLKRTAILESDFSVSNSWLWLLGEEAEKFLESKEELRTESWQLIMAGWRRYTRFLPRPSEPVFGLLRPEKLLGTMDVEKRVTFLRHICQKRYPEKAKRMVLQYLVKLPRGPEQYEYATVVPVETSSRVPKREFDGSVKLAKGCHMRWLQSSGSTIDFSHVQKRQQEIQGFGEIANLVPDGTFLRSLQNEREFAWTDAPNYIFRAFDEQLFIETERNPTIGFQKLFGDDGLGAVFATINDDDFTEVQTRYLLQDVLDAFSQGLISQPLLRDHLISLCKYDQGMIDVCNGLKALSVLALIYKKLRGSGISLQLANHRINDWKWSQSIYSTYGSQSILEPIPSCSREEAFACIAACDSGSVDLSPESVSAVMAISSGNSLYVAESLLRDPCEGGVRVPVERFTGNVGRAGMVLMIAPQKPRVTRLDESTWHLINHSEFDGSHDDMFQQLTLHLSISDWQQSIGASSVGNRDTEACFVNGFVGLHNNGTWVADLDILGMMFGKEECIRLPSVPCLCPTLGSEWTKQAPFPWALSCIDRWEELIECPPGASIIRARGNWQARLALAALSVQLGHTTYIISAEHCWKCCIGTHIPLPANPYECFPEDQVKRGISKGGPQYEEGSLSVDDGENPDERDLVENYGLADTEITHDELLDDELLDDELWGGEISDDDPSYEEELRSYSASKTRSCDIYIW